MYHNHVYFIVGFLDIKCIFYPQNTLLLQIIHRTLFLLQPIMADCPPRR